MRAGPRIPATMAWLTLLWVLLWGHVSFANVLGGLAVSVVVVLFARLDSASLRPTRFRPWWAVVYLLTVGWQLLVSNIRLAREILTPGDGTHTGIIAVPIRGGSDAVVNLVANSITLTPGTMTIDVKRHDGDPAQSDCGATLYIHCIYSEDVDALRRDVLALEALALRAFGTLEEYELARGDVTAHEARVRRANSSEADA